MRGLQKKSLLSGKILCKVQFKFQISFDYALSGLSGLNDIVHPGS
jgi:hypothetical protein